MVRQQGIHEEMDGIVREIEAGCAMASTNCDKVMSEPRASRGALRKLSQLRGNGEQKDSTGCKVLYGQGLNAEGKCIGMWQS